MPRPPVRYKIEFPGILYSVGSCVYKLWYGTKYIFVKAKNCSGSLKMIQNSLNQFMKGSEAQRKPDNLYLHFFNYFARNTKRQFRVEVLSSPGDTDYNLLVLEERLVTEARNDTKCLNNINGAYINQWNEETQSYNWLSKPTVANFTRNRKKNAPRKKRVLSPAGGSDVVISSSGTKKAIARKKTTGKSATAAKSKIKPKAKKATAAKAVTAIKKGKSAAAKSDKRKSVVSVAKKKKK